MVASMIDPKLLDDLAKRMAGAVPPGLQDAEALRTAERLGPPAAPGERGARFVLRLPQGPQ